jgi:hypothetical protein
MKLPDSIEQAIQAIEQEWSSRPGQQAGVPRARELRTAIEEEVRKLKEVKAFLPRITSGYFGQHTSLQIIRRHLQDIVGE